MNVSKPAIERPVATSLLTFALLLAGGLAYTQLPVSPLPQGDFPGISVGASLPGASPETMASSVATPLERQFGRISGINQMTSVSQLGTTGITMQFDLDRNIDAAARDVQAAIFAARGPKRCQPNRTEQHWSRLGGGAQGCGGRDCKPGQGVAAERQHQLDGEDQRPTEKGKGLPSHHRRLQKW